MRLVLEAAGVGSIGEAAWRSSSGSTAAPVPHVEPLVARAEGEGLKRRRLLQLPLLPVITRSSWRRTEVEARELECERFVEARLEARWCRRAE